MWDHKATFVLKKDQLQHVEIKAQGRDHHLAFRWTLYKNGGLVMHISYDRQNFQPLLYAKYRKNSFMIDLFSKPADGNVANYWTPYALLQFKAFDPKKREAWFDLLIKGYGKNEIYFEKGR
ncbi:hypothetical protein [Hydrogenimonas sp.]